MMMMMVAKMMMVRIWWCWLDDDDEDDDSSVGGVAGWGIRVAGASEALQAPSDPSDPEFLPSTERDSKLVVAA